MPAVTEICCDFVGLLFLTSAWAKLADPRGFLEIAARYPVRPVLLGVEWARGVPALELVLGGALLSSQYELRLAALIGSFGFLLLTTAVVAWRLGRGETSFRCGCTGALSEEERGTSILLRNALFVAIVSAAMVFHAPPKPFSLETLPSLLTASAMLIGVHLVETMRRGWRFEREWMESG